MTRLIEMGGGEVPAELFSSPLLLDRLGRFEAQLPLAGVRILDLTRVWAGPLAARQLADLGAEVIRIEHPNSRGPATVPLGSGLRLGIFPGGDWKPDPWNRQGAVNKLNRNKLSLALDVQKPGGMEILRRLISVSDVLMENFSSRVMTNWGLGWEALQEVNPRLVYLAMPGFGSTGPYRDYVANGAIIEPHSGLSSLMAYEKDQPYRTQATYSDPLVGVVASWAVVAGLLARQQTGEGSYIDLAHTETTSRAIGAEILADQGGAWEPTFANRDPVFAPQGVYPCCGEDEWVAVTVTGPESWVALCALLGRPEWAGPDEMGSAAARRANHDQIDVAISSWTSKRNKFDVMKTMQESGIAAGAVLTNQDMVESDVLAPDFFVPIEENWGGVIPYPAFPVNMGQSARINWHRSPTLGEHNRLVLADLLGLSPDEIDALYKLGAVGDRPQK